MLTWGAEVQCLFYAQTQNILILSYFFFRLATLPSEIGCLISLKTLSLSENVITSLPEQLANLQNLK